MPVAKLRHSFNDIADTSELVSLRGLPAAVEVGDGCVSFSGGLTYGDLAACGVAVHNLASLPQISVAGAVATATHGSRDGDGNLATAVRALELLTSDGELVRAQRGDRDFDGAVVGLGALGAVTRPTLDAEPELTVRQRVFEDLPWETLFARRLTPSPPPPTASACSRAGRGRRAGLAQEPRRAPGRVLRGGARAARAAPDPRARPGQPHAPARRARPSWQRIPHVRMGFTPSNGDELQSEY